MNDIGLLCCGSLLLIALFVWFVLRTSKPKRKDFPKNRQIRTSISSRTKMSSSPFSVTDRFQEVLPGKQSRSPQVTLTYSFETGHSRFIKDAQKYHSVEGKPAEPVPFMQYWPTYDALNSQQKKWYFYWRSEVRQGRYPKTDLSYIFIHVYELLCLVETSDPTKAAERIKTLWKAYRLLHPKLDRYLPEWGGDLVTAKVGASKGLNWWLDLMMNESIQPPAAVINVLTQKAIESGKGDDLPYAIWSGINLYHPQNKFYQRYNQNGAIDREYMKAIRAVDEYLRSLKTKKGLLERYALSKLHPQTKPAFLSAIVPDNFPTQINYGEACNFAGSSRLGNLLAAITKYTENILRKQLRFSARLSGFELEEQLKQVIDAAFTTSVETKGEEPIHITLDPKRVEVLQQESVLVDDLLEPEVDAGKPLYSDIMQVRSLWEKLDLPAKRLLLMLYNQKLEEISQVNADTVGTSIAPLILIDRINNLSLPLLGDRIISIESRKQIIIAEDFMDEMELIARDHPLDSLGQAQDEQTQDAMDDPWQLFLQQLSSDETSLLSLIVSAGSLSEDEIETFARERNQIGNLLIDSLNEKAIVHMGRTPFYTENDQWFIEEEDLGILREIVCSEGA